MIEVLLIENWVIICVGSCKRLFQWIMLLPERNACSVLFKCTLSYKNCQRPNRSCASFAVNNKIQNSKCIYKVDVICHFEKSGPNLCKVESTKNVLEWVAWGFISKRHKEEKSPCKAEVVWISTWRTEPVFTSGFKLTCVGWMGARESGSRSGRLKLSKKYGGELEVKRQPGWTAFSGKPGQEGERWGDEALESMLGVRSAAKERGWCGDEKSQDQ